MQNSRWIFWLNIEYSGKKDVKKLKFFLKLQKVPKYVLVFSDFWNLTEKIVLNELHANLFKSNSKVSTDK